MTLTEFLLARFAEDEAVARTATPGPWNCDATGHCGGDGDLWAGDDPRDGIAHASWEQGESTPADFAHIARHDPVRVLAECEAKRRIVGVVSGWQHEVNREDCWYTCAAATEAVEGEETCDDARRGTGCDCGLEFRRRAILAPLALPYAAHQDYRDEWRP